jgi:hypothetical protein
MISIIVVIRLLYTINFFYIWASGFYCDIDSKNGLILLNQKQIIKPYVLVLIINNYI